MLVIVIAVLIHCGNHESDCFIQRIYALDLLTLLTMLKLYSMRPVFSAGNCKQEKLKANPLEIYIVKYIYLLIYSYTYCLHQNINWPHVLF